MKAISLFSGAGGDTLGMIKAGIDVIGYVEMDKNAISTHETNFRECKCIGTDITKIDDQTFLEYKDNVDIIFGGFPCQSFSHGGKKKANDKRGFLYQEFVRCARLIKPKIIIGENVKGLLSRKTEEDDYFLDNIIKEFSDIGYNMKISVFNMKNYGIPQDRERILIYGIRSDLDLSFNLSNIEYGERKVISDILENSLHNALKIEKKEIISLIKDKDIYEISGDNKVCGSPPTNLVKCYNSNELSFKKRSKSTYSCIVDRFDVSRTILSTYGRMPRLFLPVRNKREYYLRPFTVKELAQIQGFPESFEFCGNYLSQVTQIGNAIPPIFVEKVFKYIKDIISGDIIEL